MMALLRDTIKARGLTQTSAARLFSMTQPRKLKGSELHIDKPANRSNALFEFLRITPVTA
jgi:hypothetical protein